MAKLAAGDRLVLASHNPGKLREIRDLVAPFGIEVVSAGDLGVPEPEETGVTFEENAGKTLLVVHDLYPSKEALDSGSTGAMPEALDQLDELLASLGSSTETK